MNFSTKINLLNVSLKLNYPILSPDILFPTSDWLIKMAGVESPLVCDILSYADPETGLMPEGFMDSIGNRLKI